MTSRAEHVHDERQSGGIFPRGTRFFEQLQEVFFEWVAVHSRWLRWVLALDIAVLGAAALGGMIVVALDPAESILMWGLVLALWATLTFMLVEAPDYVGIDQGGRTRLGHASYDLFFDEIVARDRFVSASVENDCVVLHARDPKDRYVLIPPIGGMFLEADQAVERVRRWFATAPSHGRSGRRPSPVLVAGVLLPLLSVPWGALWMAPL